MYPSYETIAAQSGHYPFVEVYQFLGADVYQFTGAGDTGTSCCNPDQDALSVIRQVVMAKVPEADRDNVQALIVEELRRLHEGVLARYGLRPSELAAWKASQVAGPPN